ncbi:MAG: redoxin domain-containing protein [Pirellulaceae bacterium]|nr:redoxin domain-containing protein [Pirellulaceae bacterium]
MKTFLALACTVALVLGATAATSLAADELKVGDDAPSFELVGSDGHTHKTADFKGKKAVVIAWYPKAFTGGCTKECESFRDNGKAIREFEVAYFTASTDKADVNKKFAESLKVDYPILSDPDGKFATALGIFNADKKFANRVTFYIGKDGKILAIDKAVKVGSHGADIAAKLKELGVAKK